MKNYFNTTLLDGSDLIQSEQKAENQNEKILKFFQSLHHGTPSNVWAYAFNQQAPLTSIRRGITTLTKQGKLVKSELKAPGIYGKPEYIWHLKQIEGKQNEFKFDY